MSIENEDIYKLLCSVHQDIGELKGGLTGFKQALSSHVEDDLRLTSKVDELRLEQAQQRGRTKAWGILATGAGVIASAVSAAAALVKWH